MLKRRCGDVPAAACAIMGRSRAPAAVVPKPARKVRRRMLECFWFFMDGSLPYLTGPGSRVRNPGDVANARKKSVNEPDLAKASLTSSSEQAFSASGL